MILGKFRTGESIRQDFLEYFQNREHSYVESSSVVPENDPTLLFTNAGMNQFKDVFLGLGSRNYLRAVNSQKCIRVSGKHNDLEEVGHDSYHHTFFEMLGNWSFGDYFKTEAIQWAWDLLTNHWQIPKKRLYVTVFSGDEQDNLPPDEETNAIWPKVTDIEPSHIIQFGKKDNFWEMAEIGPCGPNSEIHIDLTPDCSGAKLVNTGDSRVIEIWNLVFIQFNRFENGKLEPLPASHVDTGMGFERLVSVLQGKENYSTDVFEPLMNHISKLIGYDYNKATEEYKIAFRVIADHVRMLAFSIADGALPSNEGRGYVLRRIIRRAARYGRLFEMQDPLIYQLVGTVADIYRTVFPQISRRVDHISKVIKLEEVSFNRTLGRGIELFSEITSKVNVKRSGKISGTEAFKLYDTYGFPIDLTRIMANERGLTIDEEKFTEKMEEQRERARKEAKFKMDVVRSFEWVIVSELEIHEFVGYNVFQAHTKILRWVQQDDIFHIVLTQTPFYAESGGQLGDRGTIQADGLTIEVFDNQIEENFNTCLCKGAGLKNFLLQKNLSEKKLDAYVDTHFRKSVTCNHTTTHILQAALRKVLGNHVRQAGSRIDSEHLRFDFAHYGKLHNEQILQVEKVVNEIIQTNYPVKCFETKHEKAKEIGATALFGEKYGDIVRVVQIGENDGIQSLELCGGCHVENTGEIGSFLILAESSSSSGIRRIEAVSGQSVLKYVQSQRERIDMISHLIGTNSLNIKERIMELIEQKSQLEKRLKRFEEEKQIQQVFTLMAQADILGTINFITYVSENEDTGILKDLAEKLRNSGKPTISLLFSTKNSSLVMVCSVSDDLVTESSSREEFSAVELIKKAAKHVGGGGGGKVTLATAGAKSIDKIDEVKILIKQSIENILLNKI